MNKVKKIQVITTCHNKEHITMQETSSTVSFSPSFSFYAPGNDNLVEAAFKAVRESQSYYSVDDVDFEFETSPLREESFFHFPTTIKNPIGKDDVDAKNLFYGGWNLSSPSESNSSSESDDSEDISSSKYFCFWSPSKSPTRGDSKKSTTLNVPKRCGFKEFLTRSHSDGAIGKRCSFKDLLRRSHSHGGSGSEVVKGKSKATLYYKPEVDKRRKTYLPYRQNLIGVFAGMSRLRH